LSSLLWTCTSILAQVVTTAPAGTATAPVSGTRPGWVGLLETPLFPLLIGIMILYFFVFRSKKQQDRKRNDMLAQLKRGDRVQTIGGILGTVIEARETEVLLKVDESSNTKIRFSRSAIHRVLDEDGKAEATK
jgi:preprotein translocase subunit YajC